MLQITFIVTEVNILHLAEGKTSQANADVRNIIPFDSLPSNCIHFLIAYKHKCLKVSRLPVLLENVCPKACFSQSASLILATQTFARKGGFR